MKKPKLGNKFIDEIKKKRITKRRPRLVNENILRIARHRIRILVSPWYEKLHKEHCQAEHYNECDANNNRRYMDDFKYGFGSD